MKCESNIKAGSVIRKLNTGIANEVKAVDNFYIVTKCLDNKS